VAVVVVQGGERQTPGDDAGTLEVMDKGSVYSGGEMRLLRSRRLLLRE